MLVMIMIIVMIIMIMMMIIDNEMMIPIDNHTHIFKPNNTIRNLVSDLDEWWMLSDVSMSSTLANEWAKYVYDVKNNADDAVLNTIKQKSKNLVPSELPSTSHCHDLYRWSHSVSANGTIENPILRNIHSNVVHAKYHINPWACPDVQLLRCSYINLVIIM